MTEKIVYAVLLAMHNLALVVTCGSVIINLRNLKRRKQLDIAWDDVHDRQTIRNVIENTQIGLQNLAVVGLTGFGFPIVHMLYHGHTKELTVIATVAFMVKMIGVVGLVVTLLGMQIKFGKRLHTMIQQNIQKDEIQPILYLREKQFQWTRYAAGCIVIVLIASAFLNV